jgi:hypothetical protein
MLRESAERFLAIDCAVSVTERSQPLIRILRHGACRHAGIEHKTVSKLVFHEAASNRV